MVTSICSSAVYKNMSGATGWRAEKYRDPRDAHRRILMELRSKELYDVLALDGAARQPIIEAILERLENETQKKCVDIATIAESVAPAQILTLKRALDAALPVGHNNRLSESLLRMYAAQLLLKTHHTAGKAITSGWKWPRSWVTPTSRSSGDRLGRACRESQVILLIWRCKFLRWPEPDARLANWGKYYRVYEASRAKRASSAGAG